MLEKKERCEWCGTPFLRLDKLESHKLYCARKPKEKVLTDINEDHVVADWFVQRMKEKLDERFEDGTQERLGWRGRSPSAMFLRHSMEHGELGEAVMRLEEWDTTLDEIPAHILVQIISEAADTSNTAMMIADLARELLADDAKILVE